MIANLSPFIELLAAIYLTITLDDLILKRFWTPDYVSEVRNALSNINLPQIAKEDILKKTRQISSVEDVRSRKRGFIIFYFALLMLIFIGFESYPILETTNLESIVILSFAILITIAYIFDSVFLKSTIRLIIYVLVSPIIVFVSYMTITHSYMIESTSEYFVLWGLSANVIVILLLALPVVWQLFRNWVYTRFYLRYIIFFTQQKADDYNYAINFDRSKDKMSFVAKPYVNCVTDFIGQNNLDRAITPFFVILTEELSTIEYLPKVSDLLKESINIYKRTNPSKMKLKRLSKKYDKLKPKPLLEEFCDHNNIEYAILRDYRIQCHQNQRTISNALVEN